MPKKREWLHYWSGEVSLYVSPRHLEAHYRLLFERIQAFLPPAPFTLLDYGCGEALMARDIAALGGQVALYDQAVPRQETLRLLYGDQPGITVLPSLTEMEGRCDLVLLISVIQYVGKVDLPALLETLRSCLKPGGSLIVGDILKPEKGVLGDVWSLLSFGWREGFFLDTLKGLLRTLCSSYSQTRKRLGLSAYGPGEIKAALEQAGFTVEPLAENIGHAHNRYSVMATRP